MFGNDDNNRTFKKEIFINNYIICTKLKKIIGFMIMKVQSAN